MQNICAARASWSVGPQCSSAEPQLQLHRQRYAALWIDETKEVDPSGLAIEGDQIILESLEEYARYRDG